MLVHPLPINVFLKSLLAAAESCGYLGVVVLLARERDAKAQYRELTNGWTSVHDVTGPALAVLCPVPPYDGHGHGVRHPVDSGLGVEAEGMTLEVPHSQQQFEVNFWKGLPFRPGWDEALVWPEPPAPAKVHASGWTQAVTDAAEFLGIKESHVPCLVVLSTGERHGTVIPIDKSFGVYDFLKKLMERVGSAPASLGKSLDECQQLRRQIALPRLGLELSQVQSLSRKLVRVEVLAPELIADCRARLETLTHTEASDADLGALRAVCDLVRSSQGKAVLHNLRIGGLLSRLDRAIGTLEAQRPDWEKSRQSRERLATVEREVAVLEGKVASINLPGLIRQVAAELPRPLHEMAMDPARQLPDWTFSCLNHRPTSTVQNSGAAKRVGQLGLVAVHGFLSKPSMWNPLRDLMADDTDLGFVDLLSFGYRTGLIRLNPTRVFPGINVVADSLKEYLATEAEGYERLVLVAHSQGGLVVQRCLTRMLTEGRGRELGRIRRVVLLACPNNGAEILLSLRRCALGRRHPQERQLRPLDEEVTNTRRMLMRDVVHATEVTERTCPIPFSVYAGESDNIVPPASAQSDYPDAAALPGDHSSIARPTSRQHRTYTTLRRLILKESLPQGAGSTPLPS
ncbi:esterase/lipase family protein [Streptomyces sp. NPDC059272]|uniref:esterase/lipase family protein n=1 Tax=Streptomyces sp. NPDC059272 TaxID=3346800 RepID=UPI0036736BEE